MQSNENIDSNSCTQPHVASTACTRITVRRALTRWVGTIICNTKECSALKARIITITTAMDSPHRPSSAENVSPSEEKEKPWKYIGYKVFSRWVASDPSFFVVRRFGTLNARVALSLQDEIVQLEERLDHMDEVYSDRATDDIHNGTFQPFSKAKGPDHRLDLVRNILPQKLATYSMYFSIPMNSRSPY